MLSSKQVDGLDDPITSVWTAHAPDRLWLFRVGLFTSSLGIVSKCVLATVTADLDLDVGDAALLFFFASAALVSTSVRNNYNLTFWLSMVWTVSCVCVMIVAVIYIWDNNSVTLKLPGMVKGDKSKLSLLALRVEPIPFISVLTLSTLGLPTRITVQQGAVLFVVESVFAVSLRAFVDDLHPADFVFFLSNKLFHALVTLHFVWMAEAHMLRAQQNFVLLKHSLQQWVAQKEVDRLARMRIVGYIFHEVRNPLNNIMLASDLLTEHIQSQNPNTSNHHADDSTSCEISDLLHTISKAAESACCVLNDALSLQKLEAGTFEFVQKPFSLSKFHAQALSVATPQMLQKCIEFSGRFDPQLEGVIVSGDFNRLQQVVNNFLSNAFKFTPNYGRVQLCMTKEKEVITGDARVLTVRTCVEDNGVGIEEADRAQIFQAWSQIRAGDHQKGQGSGLGLSLCKAFVETGHNGRIGFCPNAGAGSTFFFEIDFVVCDELVFHSDEIDQRGRLSNDGDLQFLQQPQSVAVLQGDDNGASSSLGNTFGSHASRSQAESTPSVHHLLHAVITKSVLIVDDSSVTRKLLGRAMESLSVSYDSCANGKEAVQRVVGEGCAYLLILMDKEMPEMDGFEATRQIRAANYTRPLVGLTGNAMDNQISDFLSAGADAVYSKPIDRTVLVGILERFSILQPKLAPSLLPKPRFSIAENRLSGTSTLVSLAPECDSLFNDGSTTEMAFESLIKGI